MTPFASVTSRFMPCCFIFLFLISGHSMASEKRLNKHSHNKEHGSEYSKVYRDEHAAHVHGIAEMTLGIEGNLWLIALESPAANLLNFEHPPENEVEQKKLDTTLSLLADANNVFRIEGANCHQLSQQISSPYPKNHQLEQPHLEHRISELQHAEFHIEYTLKCEANNKFSKAAEMLEVNIFHLFPALESIQLQWIKGTQQGVTILTPKHNIMRFTE